MPLEPNLHGVYVIAVVRDALLVETISVYCQSAGAKVRCVGDLVAAEDLMRVPEVAQSSATTVVVLGMPIVTPSCDLNFPVNAGVVRLALRGSDVSESDVTLFVHPLLRDELVQSIAAACGRTQSHNLQYIASPRPESERKKAPSIDEALRRKELILLAEDNETNRDVMQAQLGLLGYACEVAEDGVQALALWKKGGSNRYALLLTDCHMPYVDGFELTEAIRTAEPVGSHLPIIAVTANAMQGEAQRCQQRGMDDYLSKPLRLNELNAMLGKWIAHSAESPHEPFASEGRTATTTEVEVFELWDCTVLHRMVGSDMAMHRRFLEKFVSKAKDQVANINLASQGGDTENVSSIAHGLKSAARSVGALQMGEIAEALESAGAAQDAVQCKRLCSTLEATYHATQSAIAVHLNV
jgi:CheY-like chemotaxis protein